MFSFYCSNTNYDQAIPLETRCESFFLSMASCVYAPCLLFPVYTQSFSQAKQIKE